MINLIEIFCSIQGESSYTGYPCIFIRLAECNLRCNYCDTQYSYNSNYSLDFDEILDEIRKYHPIKLVEITGGEPLLQANLIGLIEQLLGHNYKVLLETNGSLPLDKIDKRVHKIIDVKTPASGSGNSFCQANLDIMSETDELKFVISDYDDYNWSKAFIFEHNILNRNILFSPVFDKIAPKILASWIVEDRLDVRFQLQAHKYIWDPNKQGV
ncbi:MAG: radical SAM protein [Candidatus Cloacimonadales bacterium]